MLGSSQAEAFIKFQSFSVATVESERLLARIQAALAGNIGRGETQKSFLEIVGQEFDKAGVTRLSNWHAKTVFRTNAAMAYSAGQITQLAQAAEDFPFWQLDAINDKRVRPSHLANDGKIFRNGDFRFWPPYSFNCRCNGRPITAAEAQAKGLEVSTDFTIDADDFIGNKNERFLDWLIEQASTLRPEAQRKILDAANKLADSL